MLTIISGTQIDFCRPTRGGSSVQDQVPGRVQRERILNATGGLPYVQSGRRQKTLTEQKREG